MRIRTKLIIWLSLFPLILTLFIGISWFQLSNLTYMKDTLKTNYELSSSIEQIHRETRNISVSLRNLVINDSHESVLREKAIIQTKSETINQNLALLDIKVKTTKHKEVVKELKDAVQDYYVYKEKIVDLASAGKKEEAIFVINNEGPVITEKILNVFLSVTETFKTNMNSSLNDYSDSFKRNIIIGSLISLLALSIIIFIMLRSVWGVAKRLNEVSEVMSSVATGEADLTTKVEVRSSNELDEVAASFNTMVEALEEQKQKEQSLLWIKSNIADITTSLSGTHDLETLSRTFLSKIAPLIEVNHSVFYVKNLDESNEPFFQLLASYAFKERKHISNTFRIGEGLIGQAALEKSPILLTNVPSDYISIQSGLGEATPKNIYILPVSYEGDVKGVLEVASLKAFSEPQQAFLEELVNGLGIILESVMGRIRLGKLLLETQSLMEEIQAQSEELQSQQEELKATNEELEEQTQALLLSEEKLQIQQEELEQTNTELTEKARSLEEQNRKFEAINREVEKAREELEVKAQQLAITSKYKSEFLANMSHELRTPLNSLLILSKLLSDNLEGNLSEKQVEYSKTIYSSGKDLLSIINDILDLTKVELGKMEVHPGKVMIKELLQFVENNFRPVANEKNLQFNIKMTEDIPPFIYSDEQRIQQVLKNLLSNAFKFTNEGEVNLVIDCEQKADNQSVFTFSVRDTGIGIPSEKHELIFQAFQQADGTTSRKYGGTGLGLSICNEISILLGGKISVESEEGKGSVFTFRVGNYHEEERASLKTNDNKAASTLKNDDKFGVPTSMAIPEMPKKESQHNGKSFNQTEEAKTEEYLPELAGRRILLVDDDVRNVYAISSILELYGIEVNYAENGKEGLSLLTKSPNIDLVLMDIMMPEMDGYEAMQKIRANPKYHGLPIIALTAKAMKDDREKCINAGASDYIVKPVEPEQLISLIRVWLYPQKESE